MVHMSLMKISIIRPDFPIYKFSESHFIIWNADTAIFEELHEFGPS